MDKWQSMSYDEKWATLEELVKRIADQMLAVVDTGEQKDISPAIVVSSGDLTEQVGMFRLDESGAGLFEVGIISQRSGIEPNIVIALRICSDPHLGDYVLVVRGVIVDDHGTGWFAVLERGDDRILRRNAHGPGLIKMDKEQDIGRVEQEMIHTFLKGRYDGEKPIQSTNNTHSNGKYPRRKLVHNNKGSFWMEVRK